jgi:HSP20 family protein
MATLVRWEPFREIAAFQNEMSRFMNGLLEGGGQARQSWVPTVDAWETEDEVVYAFDLPGIPEDKISVELDDGALTVTAEREREQTATQDGFQRYGRRFGSFARTVGVPPGASESDVKASYENGVLEVHIKKPEQPKPRKIEIGGNKQPKTIEGTAQEA